MTTALRCNDVLFYAFKPMFTHAVMVRGDKEIKEHIDLDTVGQNHIVQMANSIASQIHPRIDKSCDTHLEKVR